MLTNRHEYSGLQSQNVISNAAAAAAALQVCQKCGATPSYTVASMLQDVICVTCRC